MHKRLALFAGILLLAGAAADRAHAFASYYAVVSPGGTPRTSSGLSAVAKTAVGVYDVKFTRAVDACGFVVSPGGGASFVTADAKVGAADTITVRTFNKTGVSVDHVFSIIVSCAQ